MNRAFNPLMGTLKPQSNGPLYRNAAIGCTLAVDGWAVTWVGTLCEIESDGLLGTLQSVSLCWSILENQHEDNYYLHFHLTLSPEAIIVSHQIIWSWYTGRWWVGCYIWYTEEGTRRGQSPPRPLLVVPNVTAHPSTASVPITVLLCNGPLLSGFSVPIKG